MQVADLDAALAMLTARRQEVEQTTTTNKLQLVLMFLQQAR